MDAFDFTTQNTEEADTEQIVFQAVEGEEQQEQLSYIAEEIWNEYWPAIIGQAQTDYMVEKFQSFEAIKRDMALEEPYEYWYISIDNWVIGYTGGHVEKASNRFFISKIYLYAEDRGKGYFKDIVAFYENLAKQRGLGALYLTVNKNNEQAINAYKAHGFSTIEDVVTDIGEGFVMDDYVMEKPIA